MVTRTRSPKGSQRRVVSTPRYHPETLWWKLRHFAEHRQQRALNARLRAEIFTRVAERERIQAEAQWLFAQRHHQR